MDEKEGKERNLIPPICINLSLRINSQAKRLKSSLRRLNSLVHVGRSS
jgi:division protein CdvB (Snf7/Vps24/ESCRT-III family)